MKKWAERRNSHCKTTSLFVGVHVGLWADSRYLVFHGGSGSTKEEIKTAVDNGVVKMNVDTGKSADLSCRTLLNALHPADTQFAYLAGIRACLIARCLFRSDLYLCRTLSTRRTITSRPKLATPRGLTSRTRRYIHRFDRDHKLIPDLQFYDPRVWVREGEKTLTERVKEACADLGNVSEWSFLALSAELLT